MSRTLKVREYQSRFIRVMSRNDSDGCHRMSSRDQIGVTKVACATGDI